VSTTTRPRGCARSGTPLAEPAVLAAGGVLWRDGESALETAVVHRPKYDDWSLPKGKPVPGEHLIETAVREVLEETGFTAVVGRRSTTTRYRVPEGPKCVDYWLMRVTGGEFTPNAEVDEVRWLPLTEATALVTHEHDRAVLADLARTDVPRSPTLLLVRHARAGDRTEWDGPDELRPLDDTGRTQARRLAEVLPLFGPTAILTAERTRCRQTVEPLAERLGTDVQSLPELGEEEFAADPEAGLAALDRLLDQESGVAVVCSQGGAIPSALMAVGVRPEGVAGRLWPPSAKGSTWALGGRPGALAADYYKNFAPV
jgi:8-oxo-dGTP diphosphatase